MFSARAGLADILHAGVVVATHAQQLRPDQTDRTPRARVVRRARDATAGLTVTRLADGAGTISFAGTGYRAGRAWAHTAIEVSIVAGSVQLAKDGKVIRIHPIRHDRSRELGAFANPHGRPRRKNTATGNSRLPLHSHKRLSHHAPGQRIRPSDLSITFYRNRQHIGRYRKIPRVTRYQAIPIKVGSSPISIQNISHRIKRIPFRIIEQSIAHVAELIIRQTGQIVGLYLTTKWNI